MAILIVVVFLLLLLLLSLMLQRSKRTRENQRPRQRSLPGPAGLPIIGNLHQLRQPLHHCLAELARVHGDLFGLRLGGINAIVVSSPELAKEVLKTQDLAFCSRPVLTVFKKFSYGGLDVATASYGEHWRELRKLYVLELMSAKKLLSFRPLREEEVHKLISSVNDQIDGSHGAAVVNVSELMERLTNTITCRVKVAFGKSGGADGGKYGERNEFHDTIIEFINLSITLFVGDYFPGAAGRILDKLRGLHRRLEHCFRKLDKFYVELIEEHRIRRRGGFVEEVDFMDVLLRLKEEQPHLTDDHIKGAIMNVFIAATDTTSATLTWAMAELVNKPKLMKKACLEIRAALAGKSMAEEDDLPCLPIVKAVVNETLRLHPPLPLLIPRRVNHDCQVKGYDIAAGTMVYVNAWAIGKDPGFWENPSEFNPARFMEVSGGIDFKGQFFEFLPFGSGRRICPGMHFGTATLELALANLLNSFDWAPPPPLIGGVDMEESIGIVTHKKLPLCLVATKRA